MFAEGCSLHLPSPVGPEEPTSHPCAQLGKAVLSALCHPCLVASDQWWGWIALGDPLA